MRNLAVVNPIDAESIVTRVATETALDIVISEIADALAGGEMVTIPAFGTLAATSRAARMGRNPATGKRIEILASKSVSFKASRTLQNALTRRPDVCSDSGADVADEYRYCCGRVWR